MINWFLVTVLKLLGFLSRKFGLGAGSTWPGHIMLSLNPYFLKEFGRGFEGKIIVVAGTNGKTTTSAMIGTILEKNGKTVIHNKAGANLLNGIASSIINAALLDGKLPDVAIFEVDENTLSLLLDEMIPDVLVILNLFRDQLDRYGEVNIIASKWRKALEKLPTQVEVLLNGDDPQVACLGRDLTATVSYFGIENNKLYLLARPHAMDSINCPKCGARLTFEGIYLGHLGNWYCQKCRLKRPAVHYKARQTVLPGVYNLYNVQAVVLAAKKLGIKEDIIEKGLRSFAPAFGRQEEFVIDGKKVKIFLSKNPTGFNESLRTVKDLGAKNILLVLNDRIPDGRDVSWIWDVDFEEFLDDSMSVVISGDRAYDMGLRIKYANSSKVKSEKLKVKSLDHQIASFAYNAKFKITDNLGRAIKESLLNLKTNEILYILPTYSAMLEVRKILGGRKIL